MMNKITATEIDKLLPQTQCRDCEYDSCMLYAEAMANNNELINKCLPGGVLVMEKLGALLKKEFTAYIPDMKEKAKLKQLAVIREPECIGCKKCIKACPVDAIIGSGKLMHSVISSECTGCDLCVTRCPVDCIDMIATEDQAYQSDHARERFQARNRRLEKNSETIKKQATNNLETSLDEKKAAIAAALKRAKLKRNS